jgi:hypothetical protein
VQRNLSKFFDNGIHMEDKSKGNAQISRKTVNSKPFEMEEFRD